MRTELPRVVFMGTPDFAVESAQALADSGILISAVVTVPDKPAGRGRKSRSSAVKAWAVERGIPVLQPADLKAPDFLAALKSFQADVYVVVAFRILPREVFTIPPLGTLNLHGSLLPKFRGAAPINWALISGEKETGVTTFVIDEKVDTGQILLKAATDIDENENFGDLYGRLKKIGAKLLVETVVKYANGKISPAIQKGAPTKAPKITPELRRIDWKMNAENIRNLVRGLSPMPCAFTTLHGKVLKIFSCETTHNLSFPRDLSSLDSVSFPRRRESITRATSMDSRLRGNDTEGQASTHMNPGQVAQIDAKSGVLEIGAGEGAVRLQDVQLEGKKRMKIADFLRGQKINVGDKLG